MIWRIAKQLTPLYFQEEEAIEEEAIDSFQFDEHVKKLIDIRKKLDIDVKRNVKVAQARQKKSYDARHKQGSYEVGNLVLLKNMRKLSKKGDKMKPNWFGPYVVAECIGNNNYKLRKRDGKKKNYEIDVQQFKTKNVQ